VSPFPETSPAARRLQLLLAISDRVRSEDSPETIKAVAAEEIGRALHVARAGYGEIVQNGEVVRVERDWTAGELFSLAGEARVLDAFGPAVIDELRAGRTLVVEDFLTDPRAGEAYAQTWASIGTRSLIVVPLLSEGRFSALLYLHESEPRRWTAEEVAVAEDVALRTRDAVARARADEALRVREQRLELMVNELNHRVKNTLATVQSIAAASSRDTGSVGEFRAAFDARIVALSRAHDLLSRTSWESAELGDIVRQTLAPYAQQPGVVTIGGPAVRLSPNAAVTVHMGLHEMATNAAKYGALSVATGRLDVSWRVLPGEPPRLEFDWRESGAPHVAQPTREGFGTRLIKAVARELEARVETEVRPDGLCFRWTAAASEKVLV
jgi:two-component sensor histidine kinase